MLGQFPSVSETFILREMLALPQHGFDVVPLSLQSPDEAVTHAEATELAQRTLYLPPLFSLRSAVAQLIAALRHPAGYLAALRIVISRSLRTPAEARQLVSSLLVAAYFAVKVGRSVRHIHGHFATKPTTVSWLLAEILGCGYSFSCHARDIFAGEALALPTKIAEAEFVTVCTDYVRQRLLRQHRLVAEGKLYLIYHGLDVNRFVPTSQLEVKPRVILSVGRLVEKKGYPFLLQAAGLLRSRGAEFRLIIVGDGPERQDLLRLSAGLGLQDTVEFPGALPQQQLVDLYNQASVFALASVVATDGDRDGLPNVLLEALATGIPTVASDLSAIPELIEPHKTGLLAVPGDARDLADKLEIALYDEEFRERVRLLGREKICRYFDITRNVSALAKLFSEIML